MPDYITKMPLNNLHMRKNYQIKKRTGSHRFLSTLAVATPFCGILYTVHFLHLGWSMIYDLTSAPVVRQLLEQHDKRLKKSLGQNFLIDPNMIRKIVDAAELSTTDGAIEIGPGIGALTQQMAQHAGQVVAIEIDESLMPILRRTLADYENIHVICADVLKTDLNAVIAQHMQNMQSVKLIANLPYYITTPVLMQMLASNIPFGVVMIQKEVAARITATPGTKEYGSLSVFMQYKTETTNLFGVASGCFFPKPGVDSAVIKVVRKADLLLPGQEDTLFAFVRGCFAMRRKTLYNNLQSLGIEKTAAQSAIAHLGAAADVRAERLDYNDFMQLLDWLQANGFYLK